MLKYALLSLVLATPVHAALNGPDLARKVAERKSDDARTGTVTFSIENTKGQQRERQARMAVMENAGTHRMVLSFDKPTNIRETAFLSYDHKNPATADETWLFLPSTGRTRRVPASDQSDSFMGTELSFGDVKDSFKFGLRDYRFSAEGTTAGGLLVLKGKAVDAASAKSLGYGGFTAEIDPETWFPRKIRFEDPSGRNLKTIAVTGLELVGTTWVATKFHVKNHVTDRSTAVTVTNLRKSNALSGTLFAPEQLDHVASRIK